MFDFCYVNLLPLAVASFFYMTAGCPCGCDQPPPEPECEVCADNFNRDNSSDITTGSDCEWAETAGDADITSNALRFTSANAKATCGTDSPNTDRVIVVDVSGSTANNLARVFVGDHKVEVKFSTTAGYVKLFDGSDALIGSSATDLNIGTGTFRTLSICYGDDILWARLGGVTGAELRLTTTVSGLTNGVGTGATISGSVSFDNWALYENTTEIEDCDCPLNPSGEHGCTYCTDFTGPEAWQVELEGIADDACENCEAWNGLYILTFNSNINCFPVSENTSCCCWIAPNGADACIENEFPNLAGEYAQLTLQVCAAYDSFPAGIRVRMFHARTGGFWVYEHEESTPIDCLSISDLDVPLLTPSPSFCDPTSSTCTLTAIV